MRPLKQWASAGGVKLLGTCAGPPHLSDEPLQAVAPLDLRCSSRGETLKDEFEKDDESSPPPTAKPKLKVKCPVNCDCDVSASLFGMPYVVHLLRVPPKKMVNIQLDAVYFFKLPKNISAA